MYSTWPMTGSLEVESSYRFITIQNGADDYGTPVYTWDFSNNPFITPTPTNTGAPTPTGSPVEPAYWWHYRNYRSLGPGYAPEATYIARVTPMGTPTPNQYVMNFTGGGQCGACNYSKVCTNAPCCNNFSAVEMYPCNGDPGCGPTPTLHWVTPGPTPTYKPCSFNNHECNPVCSIDNFEGGEMWKQISTVGLEDVVVEFELKASGLSPVPHGYKVLGQPYQPDISIQPSLQEAILPYNRCVDARPLFLNNCIDCFMIEEVFEVWYTSDYNPPYNSSMFPTFQTPDFEDGGGINKWLLAKCIPREILRQRYTDWTKVKLDFSMWDNTDDNSNFGLWFRCQLDNTDDSIQVRKITLCGKLKT